MWTQFSDESAKTLNITLNVRLQWIQFNTIHI
jgi:hypothetical protein